MYYPTLEDSSSPKRIYIAGPMRGFPNFNFHAFDVAAYELRRNGWLVANPAEFDRALGFDPQKSLEENHFDVSAAIMRDLNLITYECSAIFMLDGWQYSKGAKLEHALALFLDKEVYYERCRP